MARLMRSTRQSNNGRARNCFSAPSVCLILAESSGFSILAGTRRGKVSSYVRRVFQISSSAKQRIFPLEFRRFLIPYVISILYPQLIGGNRRVFAVRDLLQRGFRQKRAIYIPRYTYVRFHARLDGISKRRDVSLGY